MGVLWVCCGWFVGVVVVFGVCGSCSIIYTCCLELLFCSAYGIMMSKLHSRVWSVI